MGITHQKLSIIAAILIFLLAIISGIIQYSDNLISSRETNVIIKQNEVIAAQLELSTIEMEILSYVSGDLTINECVINQSEGNVVMLHDSTRCTLKEIKSLWEEYVLLNSNYSYSLREVNRLLSEPPRLFNSFDAKKVNEYLYLVQILLFAITLMIYFRLMYITGKRYLTGIENKLNSAQQKIEELKKIKR